VQQVASQTVVDGYGFPQATWCGDTLARPSTLMTTKIVAVCGTTYGD